MNRKSLGALIALNVALLIALIVAYMPGSPSAEAAGRPQPGEYIIVSGANPGLINQTMIYIFEVRTGRMAAVSFSNGDTRGLEVWGAHVVADDIR